MKFLPRTNLILVIFSVIKLFLVLGQSRFVIGEANHDDRLFVNLARNILNGQWLGDFSQFTLMKGPFYSVWMALNHLTGLPLMMTNQLLYLLACYLFLRVIRVFITQENISIVVYIVLIFNPVSFHNLRVMREDIYSSLTLLVVSCAIGLLVSLIYDNKKSLSWSIGLGGVLSCFLLTREEGLWIIPSMVVLVLIGGVMLFNQRPIFFKMLAMLCVVFFVSASVVTSVALMNKVKYGIFTTCEFKRGAFQSAYAAIVRVKHQEWQPCILVPKETRVRIYAVSPAFMKVQPFLEDGSWQDKERNEFLGIKFAWALRDAIANAGYYSSGQALSSYCLNLAQEINSACDQGRLDCFGKRDSFLPPWHKENMKVFIEDLKYSFLYLIQFRNFDPHIIPSIGGIDSINLFKDITNDRIAPVKGEDSRLVLQQERDNLKIYKLSMIGALYQRIVPWLTVIALSIFLFMTIRIVLDRKNIVIWGITTSILIAIVCRLVVVCLFDVCISDVGPQEGIDILYLSSAHPLLLAFILCNILWLLKSIDVSQELFENSLKMKRQ